MTCSVWGIINRALIPACLALILYDIYMLFTGDNDLAYSLSIMLALVGISSASEEIRRDA